MLSRTTMFLLLIAFATCCASRVAAAPWVTAYYPDFEYNAAPLANLDLNSVTDLVWFALAPTSTGGLQDISSSGNMLADAKAVIAVGHRHPGTKVLLCIGGGNTDADFAGAFASGHTMALAASIATLVRTDGFDGVDVDDEGINDGTGDANDVSHYITFIQALRAALPAADVITVAAQTYYPLAQYNTIKNEVAQINIMSYDLAGPFEPLDTNQQRYTWYNAPLKSGGNTVPGEAALLPSADRLVATFESAGIPASKLAIGTAFYGYDWNGATNIEQAFTFTPGDSNWTALSYATIMASKYNFAWYHYDAACDSAFLGLRETGEFVSYDDATAVADKFGYVHTSHLGGLVCFEIGQQYIATGTTLAARNPLMTAIDHGR